MARKVIGIQRVRERQWWSILWGVMWMLRPLRMKEVLRSAEKDCDPGDNARCSPPLLEEPGLYS